MNISCLYEIVNMELLQTKITVCFPLWQLKNLENRLLMPSFLITTK